MTKEMNVLLRTSDVKNALGLSRATVYTRIKEGLLTPPIKIGKRASAWPRSEISTIIAARVRGVDDDVVRALVCQLINDRQAVESGV